MNAGGLYQIGGKSQNEYDDEQHNRKEREKQLWGMQKICKENMQKQKEKVYRAAEANLEDNYIKREAREFYQGIREMKKSAKQPSVKTNKGYYQEG